MIVMLFFVIKFVGDDMDWWGGRGFFDFGVGGRGLEGGFILKVECDCVFFIDDVDIFFCGNGEWDLGLGLGGIFNGDWDWGDGGGCWGLFGCFGRFGNGFFGGFIDLEIFFNEWCVFFFCKFVNKVCCFEV